MVSKLTQYGPPGLCAFASLAKAWQGSPNDRIRLGQIGCGGRSRDHLAALKQSGENAAIVAVCVYGR